MKSFAANVRETIWRVHGAQGKKNCPALGTLELHVKRGLSAIEYYWQAAFDEDIQIPDFRGRGWRSISGDSQQELTSENVVLQLSEYALLGAGGKVKLLTAVAGVIPTSNAPGARVERQAGRVYQAIARAS